MISSLFFIYFFLSTDFDGEAFFFLWFCFIQTMRAGVYTTENIGQTTPRDTGNKLVLVNYIQMCIFYFKTCYSMLSIILYYEILNYIFSFRLFCSNLKKIFIYYMFEIVLLHVISHILYCSFFLLSFILSSSVNCRKNHNLATFCQPKKI